MPEGSKPQIQDLEIFVRALENLLRKLIRFLVGRISLLKLNEMVRTIYIQEAERQLKLERPTKNVSLTRLAVLTGIDTRTLTKVRNSEEYWVPVHKTRRFLRDMTPEACVLDLWSSDSRFINKKSGKPRNLKINQGNSSFEYLVNEAVSSRGVTAQAMLEKLIANGAVCLSEEENEVKLVEAFFGPFKSGDVTSTIKVGFTSLGHQMETIFHNYAAISEGNRLFYDRIWFTNHMNLKNRSKLQQTLEPILDSSHKKIRNVLSSLEDKITTEDQFLAGVGIYYFESDAEGNDQ